MSSIDQDNKENELEELMSRVFPGYEEFQLDSVTPAITGENKLSFMIVCNDEAKSTFLEAEEIYIQVFLSTEESLAGQGLNLNLRFEVTFPLFKLQFFATIEGENTRQQKVLASLLTQVDQFIVWVVDEDKSIVKILQAAWDMEGQSEILEKVLQS
ncbi:MAG: hypothetical protein APF84_05615 [Gracilibacter sp. BRH_c7a]|nr:MAG: hypothetical protein APF84_05615 [Gracilibacter sp. BRH_c7a]